MKNFVIILLLLSANSLFSQGFLRTHGQEIVNDSGPVLLRGIGTGNWLLQEGYMMQSTEAKVNTHTQFRNKLIESIGIKKTDEFYNTWIENHFTKSDLDFMKTSGFNSVRVALHYKWFTLPIEDETRNSDNTLNNTWTNKGFEIIDELLSWCSQNKMYLILDMHGTPGGQGKDANISDYDSTKPSLWESEYNKAKLEALWVKLANRYKDSEWIGGFDLINETNWGFNNFENKNGCGCKDNNELWSLQERLITAIRKVNKNHIVYISGNCWGNNYESFKSHSLKDLDSNMVLTFHKYWSYNNDASIAKFIEMRAQYNLPLWMSEGGENSNAWFTDCIALFEKNNIGWSWWPVKKHRTNNILKIAPSNTYKTLIDTWKNNQLLSPSLTYNAVMDYAESHKFENCSVAKDVIYAMIEQPGNTITKPYKKHTVNSEILFADYDLGNDNYAYSDKVSGNYHVDTGLERTSWNEGGFYRNDGVDIGNANGFPFVGWTEKGEWLQYTLHIEEDGNYQFEILSSAKNNGGIIGIEIGNMSMNNIQLPVTKEDLKWQKTITNNVFLTKGITTIKIKIKQPGSNLLEFQLNKIK